MDMIDQIVEELKRKLKKVFKEKELSIAEAEKELSGWLCWRKWYWRMFKW